MLLSDNPVWKDTLYQHVYSYNDDYKDMMSSIFNKIEYFRELEQPLFHNLIYKFKRCIFEQNEIVLRQYDVIDSLLIVEDGILEVMMHVDGFDMVVARLGP
jgi:hypothetical protein